jgi:hypothetical protein
MLTHKNGSTAVGISLGLARRRPANPAREYQPPLSPEESATAAAGITCGQAVII